MRTMEDLKRQKESLFRKHPGLRDVRLLPLRETPCSHRELSAFIERCFSHDYGNESRITFTPEFLEWNMPEPRGVCALDDHDQRLGCFLSFSHAYSRDGVMKKYAIETAWSTIPEMRGKGLAQFLELSLKEIKRASDTDFSSYWLDIRHSKKGSSYRILGRKEKTLGIYSYNLIGKTFDYRKARVYAGLNAFTYAVVSATQQLFPSRRGNRFPGGYRVEPYAQSRIDRYIALIEEVDRGKRFRRVYDREDLARRLHFHKNTFHTLSYSLSDQGGQPWALLHGYKMPLKGDDWAFFADGMVFHPELAWSVKRLFLSECEGILRDEEGCIGATLVGTATEEPMWKHGYVPFGSQVLGFEPHVDLDLTPDDLRGLRIELR